MAVRPRAAHQPRERQNRPKSGRERNAKNRKNLCEQRTVSNQHPSPCGEGGGDTLKMIIVPGKRFEPSKRHAPVLVPNAIKCPVSITYTPEVERG